MYSVSSYVSRSFFVYVYVLHHKSYYDIPSILYSVRVRICVCMSDRYVKRCVLAVGSENLLAGLGKCHPGKGRGEGFRVHLAARALQVIILPRLCVRRLKHQPTRPQRHQIFHGPTFRGRATLSRDPRPRGEECHRCSSCHSSRRVLGGEKTGGAHRLERERSKSIVDRPPRPSDQTLYPVECIRCAGKSPQIARASSVRKSD